MNQLDKTKLGNNSRHTKTCLTKITIIFSSTIRLCSTFLIKKKISFTTFLVLYNSRIGCYTKIQVVDDKKKGKRRNPSCRFFKLCKESKSR